MVRANAADAAINGVDMTDDEADDFMREHDWEKWSDCREMVQSAYFAGQKSAEEKTAAAVAAEQSRLELIADGIIEAWPDGRSTAEMIRQGVTALASHVSADLRATVAAAVAAERERCAKVCAMLAGHTHEIGSAEADIGDMATAALKRQRVIPGLDGGFVVLGQRTSKMKRAEMTELIDFLGALGDQHGVKWSPTSLGADDEQ